MEPSRKDALVRQKCRLANHFSNQRLASTYEADDNMPIAEAKKDYSSRVHRSPQSPENGL